LQEERVASAEAKKRSRAKELLKDAAVFVVVAAAALGTWHVVSPRSSPINYFLTPEGLPAVPRAERPKTLDPSIFTGEVAEGYRVAREMPELLERMPCYCGCYYTHGHQNNLDCFRDRHSETCPMCLKIALRAAELRKAGYAIEDIKKLIDRRFAPRGGN